MRHFLRRWAWAVGLIVALLAADRLAADSLLERFERVRPALNRQLRGRNVEAQLSALDELRAYPVAEAVELVHASFADDNESVRNHAYATLLALNGEQEVCDALVDLAEKAMHERAGPRMVPPALAALLASNLPKAQLSARHFIDTTVAESPYAAEIALAVADTLGARARPDDVLPLARLATTRLFAEHFGVRRGVVAALSRVRTGQAIGALIGVMDRAGGEAKADAAEHLTQVTGQIFGRDAAAWQRWWDGAGASFEYPRVSAHVAYRREDESAGNYYGLPLLAERLVFVFDTSGSMQGARVVAAKRELVKAIGGLPGDAHFGVVAFNREVQPWRKQLVPADAANKRSAIAFVESRNPHSNTASYDALEASMVYDTEAVYFLSDGAPTGGKIVAPADIVAAVTATNRVRRISIYTIGIAPGFSGSPTDVFLKTLAETNLGQYRRIDE